MRGVEEAVEGEEDEDEGDVVERGQRAALVSHAVRVALDHGPGDEDGQHPEHGHHHQLPLDLHVAFVAQARQHAGQEGQPGQDDDGGQEEGLHPSEDGRVRAGVHGADAVGQAEEGDAGVVEDVEDVVVPRGPGVQEVGGGAEEVVEAAAQREAQHGPGPRGPEAAQLPDQEQRARQHQDAANGVRPHVESLVVEPEDAGQVVTPRLIGQAVASQDEGLAEDEVHLLGAKGSVLGRWRLLWFLLLLLLLLFLLELVLVQFIYVSVHLLVAFLSVS